MIDPDSVSIVNNIIEETGAKVVISSTWRRGYSIEEIQRLLDIKGFTGEIIDATPILSLCDNGKVIDTSFRGVEIYKWLDASSFHVLDTPYIILDDDSDMLLWQEKNYFRVDPYCGLTPNVAYRATRFLNKK